MAEKESWAQRLERHLDSRQQLEDFARGKTGRSGHSSFYHKYFQGYTEVQVTDRRGRTRINRIYTAPWRRCCGSDRQWMLRKTAYAALFLLSAGALVWALTLDIPSNRAPLAALPGMLAAISMVLSGASVVIYAASPRNMTLWEHQSGTGKVKAFPLISAALMVLTAAAKVAVLSSGGVSGAEIGSLLLVLLAAALVGTVCLLERRSKYEIVPNDAPEISGGCEIW